MMSGDKLSEEEMREDIKNLISWGHAHDYDAIIQEARANAWDKGAAKGAAYGDTAISLNPMHANPYRKGQKDAD